VTQIAANNLGIDPWRAVLSSAPVHGAFLQHSSSEITERASRVATLSETSPDHSATKKVSAISRPTPLERIENNRQALREAAREEDGYTFNDKALARDLALSIEGHMPLLMLLSGMRDFAVRPLLPTPTASQWQTKDNGTEGTVSPVGRLDLLT